MFTAAVIALLMGGDLLLNDGHGIRAIQRGVFDTLVSLVE